MLGTYVFFRLHVTKQLKINGMVPDVNLQKKPSFVHRLTPIFVLKLCLKIILKLELRYLVILIVNYLGDVIWTRYLTFQIKQVVVKEKVFYHIWEMLLPKHRHFLVGNDRFSLHGVNTCPSRKSHPVRSLQIHAPHNSGSVP